VHLAKQTRKKVALFDILKISLPEKEMRAAFKTLLAEMPEVVLFDAVDEGHLKKIGVLLDEAANGRPADYKSAARWGLFSVGGSGGCEGVGSGERKERDRPRQGR